MSRPEAAMDPSMEEILASIRKIIAEEPAGNARPKPTERPAPKAPERAPASVSATPSEPPVVAHVVEARQPFATAAPAPKPVPQREANAFDQSDPFAPPPSGETQPRSGSDAAAPSSSPRPRMDAPSARPATSVDTDMLFGRLAEALRGAPAAGPASAPTSKAPPPAAPASSDLEDIDDLLAEPAASGAFGGIRPDARENSASSIDFASIFPRRDDSSAESVAARETAPSKPPHNSIQAEPPEEDLQARTDAARPAVDDDLADLLADDDLSEAEAEDHAATANTASPRSPKIEDADLIDLHEDRPADVTVTAAKASQIEPEFEDLEGAEAAKSAFGALMAGLAASQSLEADAEDEAAHEHDISEPASTASGLEIDAGEDTSDTGVDASIPVSAERETQSAPVAVPAPKKPKVVAASLPIAGIGAAASAAPELPAFEAASSSPGSVPAAPAAALAPPASVAPAAGLPQVASVATGLAATLATPAGSAVGVRTVEDIVAELLRPMLREWLAENMPRMVEKALRIELAEGLKTVNQQPAFKAKPD